MNDIKLSHIEKMIYVIRGQKVMLDTDLAQLYGVETKALNRQVHRNSIRFPDDFMFKLYQEEFEVLKCQIGTSNDTWGGRRYTPLVFTESGVAMLSTAPLFSDEFLTPSIPAPLIILITWMSSSTFVSAEPLYP